MTFMVQELRSTLLTVQSCWRLPLLSLEFVKISFVCFVHREEFSCSSFFVFSSIRFQFRFLIRLLFMTS